MGKIIKHVRLEVSANLISRETTDEKPLMHKKRIYSRNKLRMELNGSVQYVNLSSGINTPRNINGHTPVCTFPQ